MEEIMRHEFVNQVPVPIDPGAPNTVRSTTDVTGLGNATVEAVEVTIDVSHTWTGDLAIRLRSPDGTDVVLVEQRGGFRDDFRGTVFRADAQTPIRLGRSPFRGTFRPEGDLGRFDGVAAGGTWTLEVEDRARQDGGALNRWVLGLTTTAVQPSAFDVEVRFLGGLTPNQQAAFANAASRWSQVITGDVPPVRVEGEIIDDVLIEAQGVPIDGPGRVLGQAGPRFIRPGSNLPIKGIMSFDTADLDRMEADGSLEDVILHEMAHVLGFGTLWGRMGLIVGEGTVNPIFVGANAMREYGLLRSAADPTNSNEPTPVPVANTGGAGTRDGHWREAVFADELLTGFLSGAVRPISAMSVGCFEDMGYVVNYAAANEFVLPSMLRIAELGLMGLRQDVDTCVIERIEPIVMPPSAMVNTAEG
jgi:subtilisin-like proprotein convertase family protein